MIVGGVASFVVADAAAAVVGCGGDRAGLPNLQPLTSGDAKRCWTSIGRAVAHMGQA